MALLCFGVLRSEAPSSAIQHAGAGRQAGGTQKPLGSGEVMHRHANAETQAAAAATAATREERKRIRGRRTDGRGRWDDDESNGVRLVILPIKLTLRRRPHSRQQTGRQTRNLQNGRDTRRSPGGRPFGRDKNHALARHPSLRLPPTPTYHWATLTLLHCGLQLGSSDMLRSHLPCHFCQIYDCQDGTIPK